jgi:hypothetical protein
VITWRVILRTTISKCLGRFQEPEPNLIWLKYRWKRVCVSGYPSICEDAAPHLGARVLSMAKYRGGSPAFGAIDTRRMVIEEAQFPRTGPLAFQRII